MIQEKKDMKKIFMLTAFLALSFAAAVVFADGIASEDNMNSLYSDHKAFKVGDIVTVLVVESVEGSQSATLKTSKSQAMAGGFGMGTWGGSSSSIGSVPSWGAAGEEAQNGGGKSSRSGTLVAKISAKIIKVLSNGNLVIKGTRIVQINDDKQNLTIEGIIRPQDIAADNTIYSLYVADAKIEFEGNGPIGEKTTPGFFTRIFDWLGIF